MTGEGARASVVSDFGDDFAAVLSQEEPEQGGHELEQQRVGTRPVDQETQTRNPQSASVPASRLRRVMQDVTGRAAANSADLSCRGFTARALALRLAGLAASGPG
jgi:hypothetical protein